ncbi:unnamed protein product [Paramecium primaurelia]|uniref:Kinesin-like protein 6 n=1 Tax=Paramecium primaurelia TaxID=5886 RepID=A0A8S1MF83_PARPR|nr:unnamed protein product [Paramecium primaurelia]
MSVKVAVRVRPYNARELELNCQLCVAMNGPTTILLDIEDPKKNRDFAFDYSFWSHDSFENDENGYSRAIPGTKYADQQMVFDTVGQEILNNAWQGYHCCLFAYGQTGAGKSYSMVGYGANKGIVPISCEEIFKRIKKNSDSHLTYEVQVSMLEIYNEKVQDLLVPVPKRPTGGLKVREHKVYGVYVEGLTKYPVDSYEAIEAKMDEGSKHRTVAATQMNASSSRAHTIIQIEFKEIKNVDGRKSEKLSVINLVDLAGSEKVGKTGAQGDRLKEAGNINKSLSVLGQVIAALADKAMGKGKNAVVPYRDSQLTRILQNALGGNSKTLMICAVSPATDNYEETLSTLRYADQAKKIKNCAVVNESDVDKKLREQQEEIHSLKQQLMMLQQQLKGGVINPEMLKQLSQIQDDIETNETIMQENQESFESKLQKQKQKDEEEDDEDIQNEGIKDHPHLLNLNEDPLLNRKILKSLNQEETHVGRPNGNPTPQIVVNAMCVQPNHAVIRNKDGVIEISPFTKECGDFIFVNGSPITGPTLLHHNDRIIFGTTTTFLVQIPGSEQVEQGPEIDWELAQQEMQKKEEEKRQEQQKLAEKQVHEEMQRKKQELEEQRKEEQRLYEEQMKKQQEDFDRKMKALEEQNKDMLNRALMAEEERKLIEERKKLEEETLQKQLQREKARKQYEDEETMKKYRIKEKNFIENKLQKYLPKVLEVNLIAKELKRNVTLEARLKYVYADDQEYSQFTEENAQKGQIQIQVNNKEEGQIYYWDLHKFSNRYYIIKDLLERYFESNQLLSLPKDQDPFWDPPEARVIGSGFLKLQALAYLMDNPCDLTLVGEHFQCGTLKVNLIPTDETGQRNLSEDIEDGIEPPVEDPSELVGRRFDFRVSIESARLPENLCKDTYVEYSIQVEEKKKESFKTKTLTGAHPNPIYNYDQQHTFDQLSEAQLNYLINGTICFKVYGYDENKNKDVKKREIPVENLIPQQQTTQQQSTQQQQQIQQQSHQPTQQIDQVKKQEEHIDILTKTINQSKNIQQQQQVSQQQPNKQSQQTNQVKPPIEKFTPNQPITQPINRQSIKEFEDHTSEQQQMKAKLQQQQMNAQKPRSSSQDRTPAMMSKGKPDPKKGTKKDDGCNIF